MKNLVKLSIFYSIFVQILIFIVIVQGQTDSDDLNDFVTSIQNGNNKIKLPITLENLKESKNPHKNHYLICRSISPENPEINGQIHTLVDDPSGETIAHLVIDNNDSFFEQIEIGSIFLILNPLVKKGPNDDIHTIIVEQDSTDFINLQKFEKIFQDFKFQREIPSEYYERNKLFLKIELYTKQIHRAQIQNSQNFKIKMLKKRAGIFAQLGYYHSALEDYNQILKFENNHDIIVLKCECLLSLGLYSESLNYLEMEIFYNKSKFFEFFALLLKCDYLLWFSINGQYDILEIVNEDNEINQEIAEFISDAIDVQPIEGKGRGMIATEDIKAGTLLVVSKNFVSHKIIEGSEDYRFSLEFINLKIASYLKYEPERIRELYRLSAGRELGFIDPNQVKIPEIDLNRIGHIVGVNSFEMTEINSTSIRLWTYPVSYFNHNCIQNTCEIIWLGEWMFIVAIEDIVKGQELTITYKPSSEILDRTVGFECTCPLCQAEKTEPLKTRLSLENKLLSAEKSGNFEKMSQIISDRLEIVKSNKLFAHQLTPWVLKVFEKNLEHDNYSKAVDNIETLLNIYNGKMSAQSVEILNYLDDFIQGDKITMSDREIEYFRDLYKKQTLIVYGHDIDNQVDIEEDD